MQGIVKFFKAEKGWGAITSADVAGDVWVHFSAAGGELSAGDVVDFDVEEAQQDPFRFRATRVSLVRHGAAPTLRRVGEQVVIAPAGTPDTPLAPRRRRG